MYHDDIPIQNYIVIKYQLPLIQKIVDPWRLEPVAVIEKLTEHFREMGVFRVPYGQDGIMLKTMIMFLKTSPDIMRMVIRARNEEIKRQKNRHAD